MRRKVVQISESTQMISLPSKWVREYNIKKGDEVEVNIDGPKLVVDCLSTPQVHRVSIAIKDAGPMGSRVLHALYKQGADEIEVQIKQPEDYETIRTALAHVTVGFEIVEQSASRVVIKNVAGEPEKFETLLRRTFLLLISMSKEGGALLKEGKFDDLKGVINLEATNNRITTMCRRNLNKLGKTSMNKLGPLYCLVEALENIADEYKFLLTEVESDRDIKLSKKFFTLYDRVHQFLYDFYTIFYDLDYPRLAQFNVDRKKLVLDCKEHMLSCKSNKEVLLTSSLLALTGRIFNMNGAFLTMRL